jgi:hypothetical protein
MAKQAISVTLEADNLTWLKGRAGAAGLRSVSELLDQLVTAARASGRVGPSRSVVGTIDLDASDPWLEKADEAVRTMFAHPRAAVDGERVVAGLRIGRQEADAPWLNRQLRSPTRTRCVPRGGRRQARAAGVGVL